MTEEREKGAGAGAGKELGRLALYRPRWEGEWVRPRGKRGRSGPASVDSAREGFK